MVDRDKPRKRKRAVKKRPKAGAADRGQVSIAACSACARPDWLTVIVLLGCLALSAVALKTAIWASAQARAMEESRNLVLDNLGRTIEANAAYRRTVETAVPLEPIAAPKPELPPVLWSVAAFQDDQEQAEIESRLAQPLLAWHQAQGDDISALLIERRYKTSKNVSVRLFYEDGRIEQFLWPEEGGASQGQWKPPEPEPVDN